MKFLFTLTLLAVTATPLFSQTKDSTASPQIVLPWFVERFKISAGAFYVVNNTNVRLELKDAMGTDMQLEKDLGMSREVTTFLANIQWQISRRSHLGLNYYNIHRNASHVLQKDIIVEDNVYPVNSSVTSFFNTAIYQFSYGYSIFSKPTFEAGLLIGAHLLHTNTGISLDGTNTGVDVQNNFGFTAPLPDLGIWGSWALNKRFAINSNISYFALTLNNKSGRLLAYTLNLTYKLVKQLDLTLGYTGLDFKVDVIRPDVSGFFKWGYNGPLLMANFSFGKKSWRH